MRQLIEFTVNKIDRYVLMYLVAIVVLPRISNFSLHRASGFIGVNHGEFSSSYSFMHYSNKSYETDWSFLNHKKGNKNLRLKDTCTFVIEKLRIKRTGSVEVGSVEAA